MRIFWSVAAGAALGGVCRYYLGAAITHRIGGFPYATLVINVTGSLLIGVILRYALARGVEQTVPIVFLTSGFCGGYTTFSTFSAETAFLLEDGQFRRAALYVSLSVLLGLAATFAGFAASQRLLAPPARQSVATD